MTALEVLAGLAELALSPNELVPSPCVSVCRMNPDDGLCLGCYRTIDEIMQWRSSSDADRRVVWDRVTRRAGLHVSKPEVPSP